MLALDRVVEEELEHALAQNKTAVVASTTSLATALARRLGVAETWFGGSVRNLATHVSSGKWSERLCPVRRSRVCESREQEEEAFALQAAVTSGRIKVLLASIAPSVIHGVGVKGFAPPPQPAFFRRCSVWIWWWSVVGTIQRWKRWPGVRKSGGAQTNPGTLLGNSFTSGA